MFGDGLRMDKGSVTVTYQLTLMFLVLQQEVFACVCVCVYTRAVEGRAGE